MECAPRGTPAAFAHIGKALNVQYVILSLDAKSILVLRHNSILVLRRHSILRRQGGVKEKGTSPTCLFKAKSDTKVELAKLTTAVCGAPRDALAAPASVLTHPPSLVLYFRTQ